MLDHIPPDKATLRKWLKAGYIDHGRRFPTEAGTPQGGISSPTMAKLTLDGLEGQLAEQLGQRNAKHAWKTQVNLVRYADDFLITGRTKELRENEVKPLVEHFLKVRGLTLSQAKTRVRPIEEGVDLLGWQVRKYAGKRLIKPSNKNVKAFLDNLRETVKANKQAKQEHLIRLLNPKLRGGAHYHPGAVAKEPFAKGDKEIWTTLWHWAQRRHPTKGRRWIKDRYFRSKGTRHWEFAPESTTPDGERRITTLLKASDAQIHRHVKIRGEANPFDPPQAAYFEDRLGQKLTENLSGKGQLLRLWWNQDKTCPLCRQQISQETSWNIPHLIPREDGGKDNLANLVLVHPNCHRQLHCRKLEVVKPAPARGL